MSFSDSLKKEISHVKTNVEGAKISYVKDKDSPFPITVRVKVPRTEEAHMFDVDELMVKLCIEDGFESNTDKLIVEIGNKKLPKELKKAMSTHLHDEWKSYVTDDNIGIAKVFSYAKDNYSKLLKLVPSVIEMYLGVDDTGNTVRRFAVLFVKDVKVEEVAKIAVVLDEETKEKQRIRREERELEKLKKAEEEERLAIIEGEKRREFCEKTGYVAPRQLSKKDQEEKKHNARMRKTASRRTKYCGPGSAEEKKLGKKAKKKLEQERNGGK